MHAISKRKGWRCFSFLILSPQNSMKLGLRISFPFLGERSLKKARYILLYKKVFSSVLECATLKNSFWEQAIRPSCSCANLGFHVAHARYVQLKMCSLLHVMMQEKEIIIKIIIYLFKVGMMKMAKRTN